MAASANSVATTCRPTRAMSETMGLMVAALASPSADGFDEPRKQIAPKAEP